MWGKSPTKILQEPTIYRLDGVLVVYVDLPHIFIQVLPTTPDLLQVQEAPHIMDQLAVDLIGCTQHRQRAMLLFMFSQLSLCPVDSGLQCLEK